MTSPQHSLDKMMQQAYRKEQPRAASLAARVKREAGNMTDSSMDRTRQGDHRGSYSEESLCCREDAILPSRHSVPINFPQRDRKKKHDRSTMSPETLKTFEETILPNRIRCMEAQKRSIASLACEPDAPRSEATEELLGEIRTMALQLGADRVGFTRVPRHLIFSGKAILYENAIMLAQDMDRGRIATSPSMEAAQATFETYANLGEIANSLADFLREAGCGAQAGMALGGLSFYPELAQQAGMGVRGRNGLLISDGPGPAQRLGCVNTSLNLPQTRENPHAWVTDFCNQCLHCVRVCPMDALYDEPKAKKPEGFVYLDSERCRPYFSDNHGCGICIAECPFFRRDYATIRERFLRSNL